MPKVVIKAVKNGPLLLIVDDKVESAFCRCGHSKNKPYCDGSHSRVGFEAEEKVAFEAEF